VQHLAFDEVGDRGQPDVGMGAHVEPFARGKGCRAHLVIEDERADHAAVGRGQGPADLKAIPQIADGRQQGKFDTFDMRIADRHGRAFPVGARMGRA
jgi:hypothetical protein